MAKRLRYFLLSLLFWSPYAGAQPKLETVLPGHIVTGEPFQVQYIIQDAAGLQGLTPPSFEPFVLVSGPHVYKGTFGSVPLVNYTYTLVALRKGSFTLPPAQARIPGALLKSKPLSLTVEDPPQALPQPSAGRNGLLPGPEPGKEAAYLQENLFARVSVDRRECYLGEPVVATFKLYSRLPSESEIIKLPGFYGMDALDLTGSVKEGESVEMLQGKLYQTVILKKAQLYPSQAGTITIDAMHIRSLVEVSDPTRLLPTRMLEHLLQTDPVPIRVRKPEAQPEGYEGAVGRFAIRASLDKHELALNEAGKLVVTVEGKGNFTQLGRPEVRWPSSFDVFDPEITDGVQPSEVPLSGSRTYRYSFTADRSGSFTIPPLSFTYFDPAARTFRTVRTDTLKGRITSEILPAPLPPTASNRKGGRGYTLPVVLGILALAGGILLLNRKKRPGKEAPGPLAETQKVDYAREIRSIRTADSLPSEACARLQARFYAFLEEELAVAPGRAHGRQELEDRLPPQTRSELRGVLDECQCIAYANGQDEGSLEELKERMVRLMERIREESPTRHTYTPPPSRSGST